jgi:hypothetical protein
MTKSDSLTYPLVMIASVMLLAWTLITALRTGPSVDMSMSEQLLGLLALLLGVLLSATIRSLARWRSYRLANRRLGPEVFNSVIVHELTHVVVPASADDQPHSPPWEVSSASLVGHDNSLALAKLRLDLERTLREVAFTHDIDLADGHSSVMRLAELLVARGILAQELVAPLRQIVGVGNKAIHGYEISDELADTVVSAGDEVLTRLRASIESRSAGEIDPGMMRPHA